MEKKLIIFFTVVLPPIFIVGCYVLAFVGLDADRGESILFFVTVIGGIVPVGLYVIGLYSAEDGSVYYLTYFNPSGGIGMRIIALVISSVLLIAHIRTFL
jgi:hypothetical protein